jgi:hypothetical protein
MLIITIVLSVITIIQDVWFDSIVCDYIWHKQLCMWSFMQS